MITHTDKSQMTFAEYIASNVGNKFFTVTFIKANGEERVLTGRLRVTKHTVSGKTKDIHNNYLCVYDVNKKGYRNVNLNTIRKIECGDFKLSCPSGYRQMTHEEFSVLSDMEAI